MDELLRGRNAAARVETPNKTNLPSLIRTNRASCRKLRSICRRRTSPPLLHQGKTGDDLAYVLYTDSHVGAPARWIAAKTECGAPTYLYLFSYVRALTRGKVRGVAHGDDISYVFDSWGKSYPTLQLSNEDRAATRLMHSCWISFARTGKPQCDGAPDWPRYARADDRMMELGVKPH